MFQLDPDPSPKLIEDDGVTLETHRGRKQDGFLVVLLEQSLYCPQHSEVIIDNYNEVLIFRHHL